MEEFIRTVADKSLRGKLQSAIQKRGPFRNFKGIVFGGGNIELKHSWNWYTERKQRERIVEWLELNGIDPQWDRDIFEPPTLPDKRPDLLAAVYDFVTNVAGTPGVRRIALLGSLTTDKSIPKDADLLVEVEDDADLTRLAREKRKLLGKTMATGDGGGPTSSSVIKKTPTSEGHAIGKTARPASANPAKLKTAAAAISYTTTSTT